MTLPTLFRFEFLLEARAEDDLRQHDNGCAIEGTMASNLSRTTASMTQSRHQRSMISGGSAPARSEFAQFTFGDIGDGEVIKIPSAPTDHGISIARFRKRG